MDIKSQIENKNLDDATVENVYGGVVKMYDGQISHINGIAVEDLVINGLLTQDYNYQMPVDECNWHNVYHWNEYLNSQGGNTSSNDSNDSSDSEESEDENSSRNDIRDNSDEEDD